MIQIPKDRKWIQTNSSDVLGNLFSTFGVDLSWNKGMMRSGDATFLNVNSADLVGLQCAVGFRSFTSIGINGGNQAIFAVAGGITGGTGNVYYTSGTGVPSTTFIQDATSGTPTICTADVSDMELFGTNLYVSGGGKVFELTAGGTWNNYDITGDTGNGTDVHMLASYANRLYVTALQTKIFSAALSGTTLGAWAVPTAQYSIDLGGGIQNLITFIRASSNRIWIGTLNAYGGKGYVYEWDGSSSQVTKSYRLDSSGALACVIKGDIPYIMNTNGEIQVWNGGTFKDLDDAKVGISGQLNRVRGSLFYNPLNVVNNRFIHPNGMTLVDGNINILVNTVNNTNTGETDTSNPAGVWEYLPDVGLYHKYGLTYTHSGDSSPFTDAGQIKLARVGAISEMNIPSAAVARNGTWLAGAQYYTNATATRYGIWYDDLNKTAQTPGYFVTTRIYSPNVTEIWQKLFLIFRRFYDSNEKIIVKYRTIDADPLEGTITWTGTSSFNTSAAISGYAVGDEVEIIQGIGSGLPSHITAIQTTDSGYMVTVDQVYTGASNQTAIAWFQKWTKIASITDTTIDFKEILIGKQSAWIKFKVWFNFLRYDEIESLLIANAPNQKVQ